MKLEDEFRSFLQDVWISKKTGRSMSPKAIGDAVSRCKRIERLYDTELFSLIKTEDSFIKLIDEVRDLRISSTAARPYAYAQIVYSLKLYRQFFELEKGLKPLVRSYRKYSFQNPKWSWR